MTTAISQQNFARRIENVRKQMQSRNINVFLILNALNIQYLSGFWHLPTERPTALILPLDKDPVILTGKLEIRNVRQRVSWITAEALYFDYPGEKPPLSLFAERIRELALNHGTIAFDQREYRAGAGTTSQGEPIPEKLLEPAKLTWAGDIVSKMRYIRDEEEISILKECVFWGNLAMSVLQDFTEAGVSEAEISLHAEYEASKAMLRAMPPGWGPLVYGHGPAHVFMKAGPEAILSHRNPSNRKLKKGDVIYANASGNIAGYSDELERNLFVGEPDARVRKLHDAAMKAQDLAIAAVKPGKKCSDIQRVAFSAVKEAGYADYVFHHVGHGRGLSRHEPPFLDDGDFTEILPNMEFSIEPKLLVEGLGHIGHSDTILVTEEGCEVVTYYPRDIESLIC
jgi:Xaa-Pro dipeptidase